MRGKAGYCEVWNQFDNSIAKILLLNLSHGDKLVVQHGEREALDLLELGEFKEIHVAWSHVPRYVRKSGKETMFLDRGGIVDLERSCINLKTTKNPKGPTES